MDTAVNYCATCGAKVSLRIPPGDRLPRHVCDVCGVIHYRNPRLVVGTLPVWEDRVLLCRRAIEPRHGKWTLPAGFMENAETVEMYTLISVPHVSQVHVFYRARLLDLDFFAGEETLELQLFRESDIPWRDIAFRTISLTLRHFFEDVRAGGFSFRAFDLAPP